MKVVRLSLGGSGGGGGGGDFETAHSEILSGGSFGLEYCVKGAS